MISGEELRAQRKRAGYSSMGAAVKVLPVSERTYADWEPEGVDGAREAIVRAAFWSDAPQGMGDYTTLQLLAELTSRFANIESELQSLRAADNERRAPETPVGRRTRGSGELHPKGDVDEPDPIDPKL